MELHANMEPELGRGDFTIWTHVGAPGRVGFLGIAATTFANPLPILGMDWFIDSTAFPLLPLLSNNAGWAAQPLPLPSDPSLHGNVAYLQSFFAAQPAPPMAWPPPRHSAWSCTAEEVAAAFRGGRLS
jgi:hypothetical protein